MHLWGSLPPPAPAPSSTSSSPWISPSLIYSGALLSSGFVLSDLVPTDITRSRGMNSSLAELQQSDQTPAVPGGVSTNNKQAIAIFTGTGGKNYILDRSTVLFAPKSDIVITTKEGEVHIKSGAVALIFEDGQAVSVLDMSDREPGAVTFVTSCYIIALVPGQQVVLTRNLSTTFNDINPASSVACRNVEKVPLNNGVVAYISEFSIVSALNTAHLYRQLAQMHPPVAFNKIMKTAASIQFVKASQPAYSVKP